MTIWHQLPQNAGQMIHETWAPAGEVGAIRRRVDRADPTVATYTLHPWLRDGVFEPQNGVLGVARRGRRIAEAEVFRLLGDEVTR